MIGLCICILFIIPFLFLGFRIIYLVYKILSTEATLEKCGPLRTIICIGSGGHTTEILRIINCLDTIKYKPKLYIVADTDKHSETKIQSLELGTKQSNYSIAIIPRSRHVNQSYFTSIISTLWAFIRSIPVVYKFKPDLIFCNGPGTCVPICLISFFMRAFFILNCRIVFIESICRVNTLSLTGRILQYFADVFVVQWPQLNDAFCRSKYFGRLA